MRLFVAVNFDDEVKKRFLEIQALLRAQSIRGNFTRAENLHLTLVFLGETPEEKLKDIFQIIDDINTPSFDVTFNRAGCFSHSRKELWWLGAAPDSPGLCGLKAIHGKLISALSDAGVSVDKRPYSAHITLGREIKHSEPVVLDCPEIVVKVNRVSLMKSEHIRGVLTYTELMGRELIRIEEA